MVVVSTERVGFRFTFRNGRSVVIDRDGMLWHLKHGLKGIEGDPLTALAAKLARSLFRFLGGKKHLGMSFESWMD
jgi:hypothetical protein